MGASQFVGRVGGLAVSLGVGVAIVNGMASASADAGSADSGSRGANATHSNSSTAGPSRAVRRAGGATAAAATKVARSTAAPAGAATGVIASATNAGTGGSGTGSLPVGDLLSSTALAVTRRQPSASSTASSTAHATTSSAISVTSFVGLDDFGMFEGDITATSTAGNPLSFAVVGASCGTDCGVGSSGGKITAIGSFDNTQQYSILPYANWLDGAAKGDQTFQVRVTETTQFDRIVASIPIVGLLASPIISALQRTPYLGDLLAPIIGASVVVDLTAEVGTAAPGDTPIGFTYKVFTLDTVQI